MKRLVKTFLSSVLVLSLITVPVLATTISTTMPTSSNGEYMEYVEPPVFDTVIENEDGTLSTSEQLSSGDSRALSYGFGTVHGDPFQGKAYATTETFSGTADKITAQCTVQAKGVAPVVGDTAYDYDSGYVQSPTVSVPGTSLNKHADGHHTITYNGELQSADTSLDF